MNMQMRIWLVVSCLVLAVGVVYALSVNSPPTVTQQNSAGTQTQEINQPQAKKSVAAAPARESLSPDLTTVNPYQFLDPVPVGKKAPDFSVKTADGKTVRLSDFKGKKNVVLVFYQGSFCAVCGAQLSDMQQNMSYFKAQDADIIAISADDAAHAIGTIGEYGLSFNVVPDAQKEIIKKYGVGNISKHNIAWPSLFIVDKQGLVKMSYADARGHRLHSNEVLPELAKITGKPAPRLDYSN